MNKLKVAVVGSGVGSAHIEAYQALPDMYDMAVLCDIDPVRGQELAKQSAIPVFVSSIDELFKTGVDLIDICTPSGLHFEQACAALKAGFDIVVEKPVARSLAEMDALEKLSARDRQENLPDFPIPLRPRLPEAATPEGQGPDRPAFDGDGRNTLVPGQRILWPRGLARHLGRRDRRLLHHARHPHQRHALRNVRRDQLGPRPHFPSRQWQ